MLTVDAYYQDIQWMHQQIDIFEPYDHEGSLVTFIVIPKFTIGISDWWNITLEQYIGNRHMGWYREEESNHHREEGSISDFDNSVGGLIGDSKFILKYLVYNEGRGEGSRLFLGSGLTIPSKNQLTKSPYLIKSDGDYYPHRHFSISSGVYKLNIMFQYYYKRKSNPVFMGFTAGISEPIKDSKYGFSGSRELEISFSALLNNQNITNIPLSLNFVIARTYEAFWDNVSAPNTDGMTIMPGIGILWPINNLSLAVNMQKPIFLDFVIPESGNNIKQESQAYQISLSVRKVLDIYIPWLYW